MKLSPETFTEVGDRGEFLELDSDGAGWMEGLAEWINREGWRRDPAMGGIPDEQTQ